MLPVYCLSGIRSGQAVSALKSCGYSNAQNIGGSGATAALWKNSGSDLFEVFLRVCLLAGPFHIFHVSLPVGVIQYECAAHDDPAVAAFGSGSVMTCGGTYGVCNAVTVAGSLPLAVKIKM